MKNLKGNGNPCKSSETGKLKSSEARMNCFDCRKSITEEEFEKFIGFCEKCFEKWNRLYTAKKFRTIQKLCEINEPVEQKQENGQTYFAFYLPTMIKLVELKSEKPDIKKFNFHVNIDQPAGLKRIDNLVGMAGFYYDAQKYWATTPEKMFEALNWFNIKMQINEDFWMAIEGETIWDFLDNNWKLVNEYRESLFVNILSLICDLYFLDSLKVDVSAKLSEIKRKIRGNIKAYGKLSSKIEFSTKLKVARRAFLRVRNLRSELAHIASETRLARFAKHYGFDVKLTVRPDLIINGKKIDVKKPVNRYNISKTSDFLTFVSEDSTVIEKLSNHITKGFEQKVDIVAIEVNHLDKREIKGYYSKWLGHSVVLEKALLHAVNYEKKGIVLLFKCRSDGYLGRVLRCKRKRSL